MNPSLDEAREHARRELSRAGVAVLRGQITSLEQFESLTKGLVSRFHQPATRVDNRGGSLDGFSSRVGVSGTLLGHAEGYYRPCLPPPDVCAFWCERAPMTSGGETFWIDGARLLTALEPQRRDRFAAESITYEFIWPQERWRDEFNVSDVPQLIELLSSDSRCRYKLSDSGLLHLFYTTSAIHHDSDGTPRFINGLLAHLPRITHPRYAAVDVYCKPSNRMHWSSGAELDDETVNALIDAHDAVLQAHRWQDGDLLLLDNHRVLHGRLPMREASERVIFSRFGYW